MQMQLALDFTPRPQQKQKSIIKNPTWVDVTDIARGVGFSVPVEVSIALSDALAPLQTEDDEDYDQRLYDALWLAHHYLSLDLRESFTFTFDFLRKDRQASLRLRVEMQKQLCHLACCRIFRRQLHPGRAQTGWHLAIQKKSAHITLPAKD